MEQPVNFSELPITSFGAAIVGALVILVWRLHETTRPVTKRSIIIPPLAMSTGFSMFAARAFRVPWVWGLGAFVVGTVVFGYPIVKTSRLTREGTRVMMRRSKLFIAIILALAAIRIALRRYVGQILSVEQTAGLFFIVAFGMIVRWRSAMFVEYRRLTQSGILPVSVRCLGR